MRYRIDLTKHKEKTLEERVVFFSLNYLRYVIVITQLFVIAVFFYRFKVDQQVVDLSEQVNQKEEIIQVSDPLIKEGEEISRTSGIVASVLEKQTSFSNMLDYIIKRVPQGVKLTKLSVKANSVQIEGNAEKADNIRLMIERIKKEQRFKQVKLIDIEKEITSFHFQLVLKGYLPHGNK